MKHHFRAFGLIIGLLPSTLLLAQAPTFQWVKQRSLDITSMAIDPAPPVLVAGHPQDGVLLVGLEAWGRSWSSDSYGDLQWTHYLFDGTVAEEWTTPGNARCRNVAYAPDGSIYALGEFLDSLRLDPGHLLTAPTNELHTFLLHLAGDGTVLWMHDLTDDHGADQPGGLAMDPVTGLHVGVHVNWEGRVLHFDADGNLVGTIMQDVGLGSIDVDAAGNVFVTGDCVPTAGGHFAGSLFVPDVSGNGYNRYLARYTADGNAVFVNFVGDATCRDTEVRSDGNGGAYWAGDLLAPAQFGSTSMQGPATGSTPDFHLVRVDSAGNYLWAKEGPVGTPNGAGIGRYQFLGVDADGNALVAGFTRGSLNWGNGIQTSNLGYFGAFAAAYTSDGVLMWVKTGDGTVSPMGHSLCVGGDGAVYLAGLARDTCYFDSVITSGGLQRYPFIAQLTTDGTTGVQAIRDVDGPVLYPDPVDERLWITAPEALGSSIHIVDVGGRVVQKLSQYTGAGVDVTQLPAGLYVLRLFRPQGPVGMRFVKL